MNENQYVIIIDDSKIFQSNWKILLNFIGENVLNFDLEGWRNFSQQGIEPDSVLAIMLGKLEGAAENDSVYAELLADIRARFPQFPILISFDEHFIRDSLSAENQAWVIQLPQKPGHEMVIKLLEQARQLRGMEPRQNQSRIISEHGTPLFRTLVGDSEVMTEVRELMHQVAKRNVNVLLQGEAGTGKEIIARNIHYHSGRGDRPFVIVNCAAQGDDFETRLFGTSNPLPGNPQGLSGLLAKADGGTLFLDKIAEMPLNLQARLLSFLESKTLQQLGEDSQIKVDVRVIVATNVDLKQKVNAGDFREDLFFAVNVVPIRMPALREHAEDIPELLSELMTRLEHEGVPAVRLNSSAIAALNTHPWPGNVRELTNLIERLSIIYEGKIIGLNELPLEYREHYAEEGEQDPQADSDNSQTASRRASYVSSADMTLISPLTEENLKRYLRDFEREMLLVALEDSSDINSFAAERLGMEPAEFEEKLKQSELQQTD